jgi:hypothetical protein
MESYGVFSKISAQLRFQMDISSVKVSNVGKYPCQPWEGVISTAVLRPFTYTTLPN